MALEAWYKAEKVEFPEVWEAPKESSDVIDYNINEEITKDASAAFNANNDTTTGMATVIPWINAPKLLAETSIIWWLGKNIVEISDYTSVSEWQPVVDRVLKWEFVVVNAKYTEYSGTTIWYFIPIARTATVVRFQSIWVGTQWVRVNCWISWTTITSITTWRWAI